MGLIASPEKRLSVHRMAIQLLNAFFKTEKPYRGNFAQRYLLEKAPFLDAACKSWVARPWVQHQTAMPVRNLKPGCCIGAIPHYRTGIGHILSEWNTGLLWSIKLGIPFVHCPLRPPWNDFFGLAGFADYQSTRRIPGVRCVKLPPIPRTQDPADSPLITSIINHYGKRGPTLFNLYYAQNSFRQDESSDILRSKYLLRRQSHPMPNVRREGLINVSVHVRRPTGEDSTNPAFNDPNSEAHRSRYFGSNYFLHICQEIEKVLGAENVIFNIFSLGSLSDFQAFDVLKNRVLHLNNDERETFHNLVVGDVLVVSPSGFSFMAGMISSGFKIAPHPWWHHIPEDSHWCRVGVEPGEGQESLREFLMAVKQNVPPTHTPDR